MAATLYLIRHGETEGDGVKRYKGTIDVPISERGIRQMEGSARFVKDTLESIGTKMKSVYCSTLQRAIRSAEIVAGPLGLEPIEVPELRERDFGLWEGMSFDEILEEHPDEFKAWAKNPLHFSPVGGESTLEVRDRVMGKVKELLTKHSDDSIAVVAHGGVNRVVLCHFMGVPLENIFRVEQDFACVNIVEFHDGYPVVKLLNGGPGSR